MRFYAAILVSSCTLPLNNVVLATYTLVKDYSGSTFFDDWNFYGSWDNLTLGNVTYLSQSDAVTQRLAYVNDAGHAVMKVDNATNVALGQNRNSIRIESVDSYPIGSVWIIDAVHIPYGCSVWPAFWTKGANIEWPLGGEIDIIEAINLMSRNQYAIHATGGCMKADTPTQLGSSIGYDCSQPSGCVVGENKPNSYGPGFAQAGGGVTATQFDVSGIYMWFFNRSNIPASITESTSAPGSSVDLSDWGPPSAAYPTIGCNTSQYFTAQTLVFDITLCGVWAGVPSIYDATGCANAGSTGICYTDNVVGPGSPKYDDAYFEVSYVRAYSAVADEDVTTSAGSLISGSTPTTTIASSTAQSPTTATNAISTLKAAPSIPNSASSAAVNMAGHRYNLEIGFFAALIFNLMIPLPY